MFADTLSLDIFGGTATFTRINQDKYSSEYIYKESASEYRLNIRNTSYTDKSRGNIRVDRHNFEVIRRIWATGGASHDTVYKAYGVFEVDSDGTVTAAQAFVPGVMEFFDSTNVGKMANFES